LTLPPSRSTPRRRWLQHSNCCSRIPVATCVYDAGDGSQVRVSYLRCRGAMGQPPAPTPILDPLLHTLPSDMPFSVNSEVLTSLVILCSYSQLPSLLLAAVEQQLIGDELVIKLLLVTSASQSKLESTSPLQRFRNRYSHTALHHCRPLICHPRSSLPPPGFLSEVSWRHLTVRMYVFILSPLSPLS
jgi:hypothetical protein